MTIITWLIFGLITGFIANVLDPRPSEGGVIGAILLGVGGAFLGGVLASIILGGSNGSFTFSSFSLAMLGALLLLLIGRVIKST